jgi:glycerophosphoryl diester phosphodiesterase
VPHVSAVTESEPRVKRVGHKGADALAPGNTPASFEAAVRTGVDMIEFDVLRGRDGRLVLAHDYGDAGRREPLGLDEGLDHLAGDAYTGIEFDVDMKLRGYEREVVEGLRAHGLLERSMVSTMHVESLDRLRRLAPGLRRGWTVPRVRRDYTRLRWAIPAYVGARVIRARLPGQAAAMLVARRCEAVFAHWMVVSAALVRAVHAAGGELYVWTVDDARRVASLVALGVDAVITNDPRLFGAHARAVAEPA